MYMFGKLKGNNFWGVLTAVLSSRAFPFFTAALVIVCYYLGLDMVTIYFLGVTAVLMLLFLDDLTPLVSHLLFFNVIVSLQNSPSEMAADAVRPEYYSRPENLALIGVILGLVIIAIILRFVTVFKDKNCRPTPVLAGLCVLGLAFLLSGIGKEKYSAYDFIYALVMTLVYAGMFALVTYNVKICEDNYKKICFGFLALSAVLVTELFVLYVSKGKEMLNSQGEIVKEMVVLGWGIWNTVGMLLVVCIPPVVMLATKYEYGFGFLAYATLLAAAVFLTTSRQSMVGVMVVYPASLLLSVIKSKNRKITALTATGIVLVAGIAVISKWETISRLLGSVWDNLFDDSGALAGNGRLRLVNTAMQFFADKPLFGSGFFLSFQENDFTGLKFVPEFACNTYAEILAACGMFGFIAYLLHRVQTFVGFSKNPTFDKAYFALIIAGLLITSLFDNHMFNILPNLIYSSVLPFALGESRENRAVFRPKKKKPDAGGESAA